jgi:hypothetical protein
MPRGVRKWRVTNDEWRVTSKEVMSWGSELMKHISDRREIPHCARRPIRGSESERKKRRLAAFGMTVL